MRLRRQGVIEKRLNLAAIAVNRGAQIDQTLSGRASLSYALSKNADAQSVWLSLTILKAAYPVGSEVTEALNLLRIMGPDHFVSQAIQSIRNFDSVEFELLSNEVLVDVYHTANTELATGIQRVVRQTASRWMRDHNPVLVTWTLDQKSLRRLTPAEEATALHGAKPAAFTSVTQASRILVPLGGFYVMPELGAEHWRTARIAALAEFGGLRSGAIGHDCVPLTTAETTGAGMPAGFARYLAALTRMDGISVTSVASNTEYQGWKKMLSGIGYPGPSIALHALASNAYVPSFEEISLFETKHRISDAPLVVVVGSHEPRKNHLTVLRAAEELWRAGLEFELLFIGGNSWNNKSFAAKLELLKSQGRCVNTASAITDADLYSAYVQAAFTVYPSLNEGFGLPVAESLLLGTPVITSNFGSMADLGAGKGALLVDPRSPSELVEAISLLLTQRQVLDELVSKTSQFEGKSWDDYAAETWKYFVEDYSS